jgi:release factor glutamine methyltransferase
MSSISHTQTDFGSGTGAPATESRAAATAATAGAAPAPKAWTVRSMLDWTRDFLGRKGIEQPRLSAEWLLCAVTGLSRVELYMNYDRPLEQGELSRMHDAVLRRAQGEPLQYVTGEMPFRHIVLRCAPGVLIPRPETEILVDEVLAYVKELPPRGASRGAGDGSGSDRDDVAGPYLDAEHEPKVEADPADTQAGAPAKHADSEPVYVDIPAPGAPGAGDPAMGASAGEGQGEAGLRDGAEGDDKASQDEPTTYDFSSQWPSDAARDVNVLEVGTGTGCIALSLAGESPRVRVTATDISPQAVDLARRNRDALGLSDCVDVVECDLADGVEGADAGAFDVLVSNPPYIPTGVLPTLPHEVGDYEPALALDGGPDGLDVFRRLVELGTRALRPGGLLACELFEDSLVAASELPALRASYEGIRIVRDLTGRNRHLVARLRGASDRA